MKASTFLTCAACIGFAIGLALPGCATTPQSPAQAVFAAKATFLGAVRLADQYQALPTCGAGAPPICKQLAVVDTLRKSANAANTVLDSAQDTVTNPVFASGSAASQAVVAAQNAVAAFAAITSQLQVK